MAVNNVWQTIVWSKLYWFSWVINCFTFGLAFVAAAKGMWLAIPLIIIILVFGHVMLWAHISGEFNEGIELGEKETKARLAKEFPTLDSTIPNGFPSKLLEWGLPLGYPMSVMAGLSVAAIAILDSFCGN